jgi:hypothetical protein
VTSSNHEGKTPESASLAQPLIWLPRETNWKPRSPGAFISDGKATGSLCFQSFIVNEGS